jgi:hypothetical protein
MYSFANEGSHFRNIVVTDHSKVQTAPRILGISAAPSTIMDDERTQLYVDAVDYDGSHGVLTYQWEITSGHGGTLYNPTAADPMYEPGNVTGTQEITFVVHVSNIEYTVSRDVTLTVLDRDEILLIENFDNGADDWNVVDEGTENVPSEWVVENETFVQRSPIYTPESDFAVEKQGTYALFDAADTSNWTDYRMDVSIRSLDDGYLGVMFRVLDKNNFYRISWNRQDGNAYLVKCENGNYTLIAQKRFQMHKGQVYDLNIIANGALLQVFVNGQRLMEITDNNPITEGTVGLYSYANAGGYFDNIYITKLP